MNNRLLLFEASIYDELLSDKIKNDNMGLLTVFKYLETRLKYHGEDLLINYSCNLMIQCGKEVTQRQIRRLCNYAKVKTSDYLHYAVKNKGKPLVNEDNFKE